MDKYSKYYGVIVFLLVVVLALYGSFNWVKKAYDTYNIKLEEVDKTTQTLNTKRAEKKRVENTIAQIKSASSEVQKQIFAPADSDLGNDTLFFQLYSDLLSMIHSNSVKIKSMQHEYNPQGDAFVGAGNGIYFVSDINMELVSNFRNLDNLIEDIYQYNYYIRINNLEVRPYQKDKRILLSKLSLRLYSRTAPIEADSDDE